MSKNDSYLDPFRSFVLTIPSTIFVDWYSPAQIQYIDINSYTYIFNFKLDGFKTLSLFFHLNI